MEKMTSIKSDVLKYIREYYQVSLEEVCDKTKIKIEALQKYESGEDFPSYPQLEKLADYYNRPVFFFFANSIPNVAKIQVAFRSIENQYKVGLTKPVRELIEKADMYRLSLEELFAEDPRVCFTDIIKNCKSEEGLMDVLRAALKLDLTVQGGFTRPENLLEFLRTNLFENGIYVFKDSFKNDDISGLCVYDEKFPVILINNKMSFKRQIFTLFHEIYHIYLKEADIDYTNGYEETKCNNFASNFLIPETDLLEQIERIDVVQDIDEIDNLAKRYNVSRDALMYRLLKMELIDKDFFNQNRVGSLRKANAMAGGNFYYTKMSYLGSSYLNKVFSSYYSGKITKSQVGIYTGLKTMHVSKLASKMMGGVF
ncbi:MAG: ImmA/IrrE family metallo-endopeptidase [Acetatifactor sp.]|nr:ImmA/IrrE family metallo-endopeptidase [Acetatifactor sp.]